MGAKLFIPWKHPSSQNISIEMHKILLVSKCCQLKSYLKQTEITLMNTKCLKQYIIY